MKNAKQKQPERFWTSDPHFGHKNIITYTGRPYRYADDGRSPNPEKMNAELIRLHNLTVPQTAELWVLGDLSLSQDPNYAVQYIKKLNGERKIFVVGNHDINFRKPHKDHLYTHRDVFHQVIHGTSKLKLHDGKEVLVSHFPYEENFNGRNRYRNLCPKDDGEMWLIHGHVHEKWRVKGRQINVGVDAWGGKPVNETVIMEIIHNGPTELPPLPWK